MKLMLATEWTEKYFSEDSRPAEITVGWPLGSKRRARRGIARRN